MFREMRRKRQQLPHEASIEILEKSTSGTLAVSGDDGYPYAVPLSYVYKDGKIYFHCAKTGHKLDAIRNNPKASFCIIAADEIVPEKFTTCFKSVIAFGTARIMEGDEMRPAIDWLAEKYSPNVEGKDEEIGGAYSSLCMIEFTIEHMTGKEAIEHTRMRTK